MIGRHPEGRGGALIRPGRLASWLRGAAEKIWCSPPIGFICVSTSLNHSFCPCKQSKTLNNFKTIIQFRPRTRPGEWSHEGGLHLALA
jgi:hypothetical protein